MKDIRRLSPRLKDFSTDVSSVSDTAAVKCTEVGRLAGIILSDSIQDDPYFQGRVQSK